MVNKLYFNCNKIIRLILAAGKGYADIVKILLDNGANIEAKDVSGNTAIIYGK